MPLNGGDGIKAASGRGPVNVSDSAAGIVDIFAALRVCLRYEKSLDRTSMTEGCRLSGKKNVDS